MEKAVWEVGWEGNAKKEVGPCCSEGRENGWDKGIGVVVVFWGARLVW